MTLQTLRIGRQEFILLSKRDFTKLAAQADRQAEDDYWTSTALDAEKKSQMNKEKPIPFSEIERELNARSRRAGKRRVRR